jgi:hypothetical protein
MDRIGHQLSRRSRSTVQTIIRSEAMVDEADALIAASRVVADEAHERLERSKRIVQRNLARHDRRHR